MKLQLKESHLESIVGLCLMAAPNLGGGFILGDTYKGNKVMHFPYNVRNKHDDPVNNFKADWQTTANVEAHAKIRSTEIIGLYQSVHAEKEFNLEEFAKTAHPFFSYLIVPLREDGTIGSLSCYRLEKDQLVLEELDIEGWLNPSERVH